jgi:hypothetical protein
VPPSVCVLGILQQECPSELASALSAPVYFGRVSARPFSYLCVRHCAVAVPLAALPFVLLLLLLAACTQPEQRTIWFFFVPGPARAKNSGYLKHPVYLDERTTFFRGARGMNN